MRMALLVHDIGKSEAVKKHDKPNQKQYNEKYAREFMRMNNVDEDTAELILAMIGEGMELTTQLMVKRDKTATMQLGVFCGREMRKYMKTNSVD